ncbi:uncharacterized mitochondrial protein-like protein [Tanacetum coccineum]
MTIVGTREVVNIGKGKMDTELRKSRQSKELLQDHAVADSGCSSHMTGNKAYLSYYEDYNGGFVAFRSDPKGGKIMEFEDCMHKRFQMSSMGKLTFFLGLQVKQQPDGIFISQDKYVADILKKFDFLSIKTATTPIESNKPLIKDEDGVDH